MPYYSYIRTIKDITTHGTIRSQIPLATGIFNLSDIRFHLQECQQTSIAYGLRPDEYNLHNNLTEIVFGKSPINTNHQAVAKQLFQLWVVW